MPQICMVKKTILLVSEWDLTMLNFAKLQNTGPVASISWNNYCCYFVTLFKCFGLIWMCYSHVALNSVAFPFILCVFASCAMMWYFNTKVSFSQGWCDHLGYQVSFWLTAKIAVIFFFRWEVKWNKVKNFMVGRFKVLHTC